MKILITAGGTTERIDDVRAITNMATGRLGSLIAGEFATHKEVEKIFYLCAKGAFAPSEPCVEIIEIESVEDLKNTITELMSNQKIDAVIHTMAVSDYTLESVTTAENMAVDMAKEISKSDCLKSDDLNSLTKIITESIIKSGMDNNGKVSSDFNHLIISMKKTPKIIGLIKKLQPSTVLVGFKLLDGVSEQELLRVGHALLLKNNCNFVLANDLQKIQCDNHMGILIKMDKSFVRMNTKAEIATEIVRNVISNIGNG